MRGGLVVWGEENGVEHYCVRGRSARRGVHGATRTCRMVRTGACRCSLLLA